MSEKTKSMVAYVCIDGIICTIPEDRNYDNAEPLMANIAKINKLFYDGWAIVCWSNRGHATGIDWTRKTMVQLDEWNVKYTQIRMEKPVWGLVIDPDSKRIEELPG